MKKTGLIVLFALFVTVMIIGCGNSKQDPTTSLDGTYTFFNSSTTNVDTPDTNYVIFTQLLKDGIGLEGREVRIGPFDVGLGYVRPSTVYTDIDGWAIYTYTSPNDTEKLIGQSALLSTVYDDGNGTITFGTIDINFVAPPPPDDNTTDGNGTTSPCSTGTCPLAP